MQEEVLSLFNLYNNKFNNFVNSFDKKDVICQQNRNTENLWLQATQPKNTIADNF